MALLRGSNKSRVAQRSFSFMPPGLHYRKLEVEPTLDFRERNSDDTK
eukprot:SAG31_NODE_20732_length_566_cov_1.548180_2_plen_46_part_01